MKTTHKIYWQNANSLYQIDDSSIDLVVTSPPYPMVAMWDEIFVSQNKSIKSHFDKGKEADAFEEMHKLLDKVWDEIYRVTKPGGIVCINIGDATRTINNNFQLFSNHARIINHCLQTGFQNLPNIIWRKTTNAPNKFMGSGMLPTGAYVTLEHEYILVFRKGTKRLFKTDIEKQLRNESSYFWEERNQWFSDVWHLAGTGQTIKNSPTRDRSGAFPFELAYRLINMYSVKNDVILDPFMGTGTSMLAAICARRNSIGCEIDKKMIEVIKGRIDIFYAANLNAIITNRIKSHKEFIKERIDTKGKDSVKYHNYNHNCPVMTKQERGIFINAIKSINFDNNSVFEAEYHEKSNE